MGALEKLGIKNSDNTVSYSDTQTQTKDIFAFKWEKRDTYESPAVQETGRKWLIERYCNNDINNLQKLLDENRTRKVILDAGCGSGYSALLLWKDFLDEHEYLGVDISDAVWVAKKRFEEAGVKGDFLKCDIVNLPVADNSVDIIFSEGVLHHTDSTENAIKYLSKKIKTGGLFMFYVYAKKSVIREFTDDYIREQIKPMSDEAAWNALESLTKLGKALGDLNVEVDVPEDIPYLGIKKGKQDIQRFLYWNVFKLFYRPDFTIDEMNHINFDWYRPLNCHRQTPEQVKQWCREAGLSVEHINIQDAGITVIARKN
jgi:ubiquinone/menaquinone biosynthesis C-methylase UbiE